MTHPLLTTTEQHAPVSIWTGMRSIQKIFVSLAIGAIGGSIVCLCIPQIALSGEHNVLFPEQAAVLSEKQISVLKPEAMNGSVEAAHRLATYYAMIKLDDQSAVYWEQIRVEDGDRNARYDLGARLAAEPDPLSHIRARFWLTQVEKDGPAELSDMARHALTSLSDKEQYELKNR